MEALPSSLCGFHIYFYLEKKREIEYKIAKGVFIGNDFKCSILLLPTFHCLDVEFTHMCTLNSKKDRASSLKKRERYSLNSSIISATMKVRYALQSCSILFSNNSHFKLVAETFPWSIVTVSYSLNIISIMQMKKKTGKYRL